MYLEMNKICAGSFLSDFDPPAYSTAAVISITNISPELSTVEGSSSALPNEKKPSSTVHDKEEEKIPSPPKRRAGKGAKTIDDSRGQLQNRKSFRGVAFNRQFVMAVYMLMQYFLSEKALGAPLKSFNKAR